MSDPNAEHEKPSRRRQWRERATLPVITRPMTIADIEEFRANLSKSYGCPPTDIEYDFMSIMDEHDAERDDCLLLVYTMKCVFEGKPTIREIFSIKVPIPEQTKRMYEHKRREHMARRGVLKRKPKALPAPESPSAQTNTQPTQAPESPSAQPMQTQPTRERPVLKPPTRTRK